MGKPPDQVEETTAEALKRYRAGEAYKVSTGIDGGLTYGYGNLSVNGYWEFQLPNVILEHHEVIRDPTSRREPLWVVIYKGLMCTPRFTSPGAADAYLSMLKGGSRLPEYGFYKPKGPRK